MDESILAINSDGTLRSIKEVEEDLIRLALKTNRSIAKISRQLGISRSTLYRKIERMGLDLNFKE